MRAVHLAVVVGVVVLAACGHDSRMIDASPPTTASEIDIKVDALPDRGLVMDASTADDRAVVLVDLDGREVTRLDGWQISAPGGPRIWLSKDDGTSFYWLDAAGRRLVRGDPIDPADELRDRPPPYAPTPGQTVAGHWAYVLRSPDGRRELAQWSGECEVPLAFLTEGDDIRPIVGTSMADAPETVALGWLDDHRAVVSFFEAACGTGDAPGTYILDVDHPDQRTRITPLTYGAMW